MTIETSYNQEAIQAKYENKNSEVDKLLRTQEASKQLSANADQIYADLESNFGDASTAASREEYQNSLDAIDNERDTEIAHSIETTRSE
jgi:hypothetical protein